MRHKHETVHFSRRWSSPDSGWSVELPYIGLEGRDDRAAPSDRAGQRYWTVRDLVCIKPCPVVLHSCVLLPCVVLNETTSVDWLRNGTSRHCAFSGKDTKCLSCGTRGLLPL